MQEITKFEPFPKQYEFIEAVFSNNYKILGYGGAMGGGKTFVCLATLILLHRLYPNSKSAVIRDSLPTLKKTTIPSFKKVLPEGFMVKYNNVDNIAYFNNGSEMIFMSEDISHDPELDKYKGLEINWCFLEQMEELSIDTINMMLTRIGRHRIDPMPNSCIMYTINPASNWVYDYCYKRDRDGQLPPEHYYLKATVFDNPILSEDKNYLAQFKNLDKLTYRRYIDGDWDAFSGENPFAHAFNEIKHTGITESNKEERFYLSFDFNHDPVTCMVWQHYDEKIRCLYEMASSEGLGNLCDKIKNYFGFEDDELEQVVFVTGDRSGWNQSELLDGNRTAYDIIQTELGLTKYAIDTPKINPNVFKSRELLNGILEHHPDFLIDSRHCPRLIFDLKFVEADDQHKIIKDRNKTVGKADFLDNLRYYVGTYHQSFVKV